MTAPETETVTVLFWVMTLQWPSPSGIRTSTSSAQWLPPHPARRRDIFQGIFAEARRFAGVPDGTPAAVLFYSLQPEVLDASALADAGRRP